MAIRKQQLRHRIAKVGTNTSAAMGAYHPGIADMNPSTPVDMPVAVVLVSAARDGQYVTLGSMDVDPLWATDGAMYPAVAPGTWGQLRAAGRP